MFGLGIGEIFVIAFIMFLILKPEHLPAFFRKAGKFYSQAQNFYRAIMNKSAEFRNQIENMDAKVSAARENIFKTGDTAGNLIRKNTQVIKKHKAVKTKTAKKRSIKSGKKLKG